jgi:hypothetical protein
MKRGGLRSLKITTFVVSLAVLAVGATPAHANLAAAGPVDPSTQVPAWYQDASGIKLGLCLKAPFCLTTAAEFADPDAEAFWFNAGADLTINGTGKAKLVLAQEAIAPPTGPAAFMRARVVITSAAPNSIYNVTHPYGRMTIRTDARGNGRESTDTGCTLAPCPGFGGALTGQIGPFLTWTPDPALPPNHIGDGLTPHTVTGGTNGNSFTVAGPGGATTNLFTVAGELAGPPVPVINAPASLDFGSSPVGVPVDKTITVRSFGVPGAGSDLSVSGPILGGDLPSQYSVVGNTCAGVFASGQSCTVTVRMTPTAGGPLPATLMVSSNAAGGNGSVALSGTGVAPAAAANAIAGAAAGSRLRISKLRTTHRMSRARVLRRGLRLSMRVPQGTEILKVAVFRFRGKQLIRKPIWLGYRVVGRVGRSGLYRIRLDSRTLRRRMKAGRYQLNVTPGISKRELGVTTTTPIRITRR